MFNGSNIQSWHDMVSSFDPVMVQWLAFLLAAEFILGVLLAFKQNQFSFDEVFDIGKKLVTIAVVWGIGNILDPNIGHAFYGLAVSYLAGGAAVNLSALSGWAIPSGIIGQLFTKGNGDGKTPPNQAPITAVQPTNQQVKQDNALTIK